MYVDAFTLPPAGLLKYYIYIYILYSKVSAQVVVCPVPFTLVGRVFVSRPRALFGLWVPALSNFPGTLGCHSIGPCVNPFLCLQGPGPSNYPGRLAAVDSAPA